MENFGSDIVQEILTRLPKPKSKTDIKTILQCRKVCRLWRSLLEKPKTGILFTNKSNYVGGPIELYYREQSCEMVNVCIDRQQMFVKTVTKISRMDTKLYSFRLVDSCNGLICFKACQFEPQHADVMCVCNPITGECIRVPDMGEGFDCAGFGYCRTTNEYKIFRIIYTESGKQRVQVYTLGDGRGWNDKQEISNNTYAFQGSSVFANGALHWLNENSNCDIVAFDLKDETFRSLPSPLCHNLSGSYENVNLGSFDGNLYLSVRYMKQGERVMEVWVFKKENMNNCGRTSKKESLCNSFIWIKEFEFTRKWGLGLAQKCQLLSLTECEIQLWQNGILSCYDRKTKPLKKLWYVEASGWDVQAIPHMNSLVSLKDLGEELVDC